MKSTIQTELEGKFLVFGVNEIQYYAIMYGDVQSAIQKALKDCLDDLNKLDLVADTDRERELLSIKTKQIIQKHFGELK